MRSLTAGLTSAFIAALVPPALFLEENTLLSSAVYLVFLVVMLRMAVNVLTIAAVARSKGWLALIIALACAIIAGPGLAAPFIMTGLLVVAASVSRQDLAAIGGGFAFGLALSSTLSNLLMPLWLCEFYGFQAGRLIPYAIALGLAVCAAVFSSANGAGPAATILFAQFVLAVVATYAIAFAGGSTMDDKFMRTYGIAAGPPSSQIPIAIWVPVAGGLGLLWFAHRIGGPELVRWTLFAIAIAPLIGQPAIADPLIPLLLAAVGAVAGRSLARRSLRGEPWEAIGVAIAAGAAISGLDQAIVVGSLAFAIAFGLVRTGLVVSHRASGRALALTVGFVAMAAMNSAYEVIGRSTTARSTTAPLFVSLGAALVIGAIFVHTRVQAVQMLPSQESSMQNP